MNPKFNTFKKLIEHPIKYKFFLLTKLPIAFISGLRVIQLNEHEASVAVKFKWVNQNPFRSIYFAVLSMAAELSTGVLAFGQIFEREPSVSMLVVKLEAAFFKKAVGKIIFHCNDGKQIAEAVESTLQSGISTNVTCISSGLNEQGEEVARFMITWSFKAKSIQSKG